MSTIDSAIVNLAIFKEEGWWHTVNLLILKNIYCQITLAKEVLVYCMLFAKDKNSKILTILKLSEELSKQILPYRFTMTTLLSLLAPTLGHLCYCYCFFFSFSLRSPLLKLYSLNYYVRCLFSVSHYRMGQGSLLCSLMQLVLRRMFSP